MRALYEEFKRFIGQPVRIFTDDGRSHKGVVAAAYETHVRIIDKCENVFFIEYSHIDAVQQPHMKLGPCHCENDCEEHHHGRHEEYGDYKEEHCREYPH